MKKSREETIKAGLIARGTLPTMPSADELKRRAKAGEPLLTIWEQNEIEGLLLAFKSAHSEAYTAARRVYRFPDDIRLAAARLARLAEAHGDEADKGAAGTLQDFFRNPGGAVRAAKLAEAVEMRLSAEICLAALADACRDAFTVKADAAALEAERELRSVFDTAKGRKDACARAVEKMNLAAARWMAAPKQGRHNEGLETAGYTQAEAAKLTGFTERTIRTWDKDASKCPYHGYPGRSDATAFLSWWNCYKGKKTVKWTSLDAMVAEKEKRRRKSPTADN